MPFYNCNVCGEPAAILGVQGGGMMERINAAPVLVGTGALPGRLGCYGLMSDDLLLDQHGLQVEMGAPG
jgi:hypothetical protein